MARKKQRQAREVLPELPEGRPMPGEASPGGVEGVEADWRGGPSNIGEVLNPAPPGDHTYSTRDVEGAPRVEVVARLICDHCGQAFHTDELLAVHMRTAHRPRR